MIGPLNDATILFGGVDVSMDTNQVNLTVDAEKLVADTFGTNGWHDNRAGLFNAAVQLDGFLNFGAGGSEEALSLGFGTSGVAALLVSPTGDDGDIAYEMEPLELGLAHKATIGQLAAYTANVAKRGKHGLIRGRVLHDASASVTATANGTGRQLGAVSSTQKLYCAVHVLAAGGTSPTLDVTVVSDDNSGFTSPTTRLTVPTQSAIGAKFATPVAGPFTDNWWRVHFAIGGTGSPHFTFAAFVGIQ